MAKTDPDEELAALEEKGRRAIREQRERTDLEAGSEDRKEAEEGEQRLKLALGSYQGRSILAAMMTLMIAGFAVTALAGALMSAGHVKDGVVGAALAVSGLLFYALMYFNEGLYRLLARVEAEERWLTSLPFAVGHYFEALRLYRSKHDNSRPCLRVTFTENAQAPAPDELQVLLATLDPQVVVTASEDRQRQATFGGRLNQGEDLVVLVHQAVPLLTLLHGKYPIRAVEVF